MPQPKLTFRIYRVNATSDEVQARLLSKGFTSVPCLLPTYKLFVRSKCWSPKWVPFLQVLVDQRLDVPNREASFVLLRHTDTAIYAVTGGTGSQAVRHFIDPDFGLDVVTRLISPDQVKAIRHKSFAGSIDQIETVYKGQHSLSRDPLDLIRATRSVLGAITGKDLAEHLGIESRRHRFVRLEGRSGFSVRRSLTIDEFEALIRRIETVLQRGPLMPIMRGCSEVGKSRAKELDRLLADEVARQYQAYLRDPDSLASFPSVSFSYEDARQFVSSASYRVASGGRSREVELLDIDAVFGVLQEWGWDEIRPRRFLKIRVEGLDDDGNRLFDETVSRLLTAEVSCDGQTYFRADGRWFHATTSFVESLESRVKEFLVQDGRFALPAWPVRATKPVDEDNYLEPSRFSGHDYRVLHRQHIIITRGNDKTELCDLLDRRTGDTAFIFVKRGVAGPVREVARQACDSMYLFIRDPAFRQRAQDKVDELGRGWALTTVAPANMDIVLAVVDTVRGRTDKPLLERMTTLAKMELAHALEQLRGFGVRSVRVYEIPVAWT